MEILGLLTCLLTSPKFTKKVKKLVLLFLFLVSVSYMAWKINYKAIEWRYEQTEESYRLENWRRLTAGRYFIWKKAWELFLENPIIGIGLGSFPYRYSLRTGDCGRAVHNAYLKFLVETGIIGFLFFIYIIVSLGLIAFKTKFFKHISLAIWVSFSFMIFTHELLRAKDFWFGSAVILALYYITNRRK